jgi:quercetin dioxygenase-like cupin family protein
MAKKGKGKSFGARLKNLREKEGLSHEDLASQVKMKASYLESLERDQVLPPVAEIITLARTLSVEPRAFMDEDAGRGSPGRRRKALSKRTSDYAYEALTPEEHDTHLMAFRVTIDPGSEHRKVDYSHEGEEFIYVLSGRLNIKVGKKSRTLGPGESIHFDSGLRHVLRNPSREPAILMVVIYAP